MTPATRVMWSRLTGPARQPSCATHAVVDRLAAHSRPRWSPRSSLLGDPERLARAG
jgi:hypothetical protein